MTKPKKIWDHFTKLGIINRYTQKRAKCNCCSFECAKYFGQDFEHPRINGPNPRYTKK
ncbi:6632_t:CDS:2 [Cetraspora pellucida]|uniref:6632_t:CDS:1 n=1 Tax=Cetraspora pellucida TaxID=1433469 RepID=A0A9N9CDA2_9GLOM|nr:6632_t:CDS:2 [Cetraspora pellucida]